METIALIAMSVLLPIASIAAFVIGYNVNADKKILRRKPKPAPPTDDELMLDRIDNAKVY
jgi:hypothetical protein